MSTEFKIHCIVLTKNEADVIRLCLHDAAKWADYIYVYDGGSTDGTWEIVQSMQSSCIIPWKQDGKVFKEGLRAEVFNKFRNFSQEGDWWLQLNADEFYPESPRKFFQGVSRKYNFVWGISVEYYITESELEYIDFSMPFESIMPALHHYKVFWSEPRAFRYRKKLIWHNDAAWPIHAGLVAIERIIFKHYPYRSPQQIQMRLDVRRDNRLKGFKGWDHASQCSWREKILRSSECLVDKGFPKINIDETNIPNHLEKYPIRMMKQIFHRFGIWP